jgi:hypothetical protein
MAYSQRDYENVKVKGQARICDQRWLKLLFHDFGIKKDNDLKQKLIKLKENFCNK